MTAPIKSWDVIVVRVHTEGGLEGLGFTYALRAGGEAILQILRSDIALLVGGADFWATERLWNRLYWSTHNAGRRGAMVHAIAAIDIALWDLKGQAAGVPLASLLGADRDSVPVYESDSGWLSLPVDELVRSSAAAVEAGAGGVKIMVGAQDATDDVQRVRAVRQAIGPGPALMVDAGQKWGLRTAIDRIHRLEEFDIYWVEEPLPCDDIASHVRLAESVDTRIATGQSLTTRFEVLPFLERRCVDVLQADVARIGGVTEWWRVAHLAEPLGVEIAPHFLMELHVSLVAACPAGTWIERTPWLSAILEDPPLIVGGKIKVPRGAGHGLRLRADSEQWRAA